MKLLDGKIAAGGDQARGGARTCASLRGAGPCSRWCAWAKTRRRRCTSAPRRRRARNAASARATCISPTDVTEDRVAARAARFQRRRRRGRDPAPASAAAPHRLRPRHRRHQPGEGRRRFHPESLGRLAAGNPRFVPCTPLGIRELLLRHDVEDRRRRRGGARAQRDRRQTDGAPVRAQGPRAATPR